MTAESFVQKVTTELSAELLEEQYGIKSEIEYIPMPYAEAREGDPVWRVRIDLASDSIISQGVELNGELILGRAQGDEPDIWSLHKAAQLGVSRHHAMLRPTLDEVFVMDIGSTNGTWLNGRLIGANIPYSLNNGDLLRLGGLSVIVYLENLSPGSEDVTSDDPTLVMADRIVSKLKKHKAIDATVEIVKSLSRAENVCIWLVNEQTHELHLETAQESEQAARQLRATSLYQRAAQALKEGIPLIFTDDNQSTEISCANANQIFMPFSVARVPIGVIGAFLPGNYGVFSRPDVDILNTAAHFLAIAAHNARLYETSKQALDNRARMMSLLNYVLHNEVRQHVRHAEGYARMLAESHDLNVDDTNSAEQVWETTNEMLQVIDQIIDVTNTSQESTSGQNQCDLVAIVEKVLDDLDLHIKSRGLQFNLELSGTPYTIYGNGSRIYYNLYHLLSHLVKERSDEDIIGISLEFTEKEITLCIVEGLAQVEEKLDDAESIKMKEYDQIYFGERGLGLSLAMIYALVEAHRGQFDIHKLNDGNNTAYVIRLSGTLRVLA